MSTKSAEPALTMEQEAQWISVFYDELVLLDRSLANDVIAILLRTLAKYPPLSKRQALIEVIGKLKALRQLSLGELLEGLREYSDELEAELKK